jgi:carboxymethylenebutenolidase
MGWVQGGQDEAMLPPDTADAPAALNGSPRHGEWIDVRGADREVPIRTWIVYPERSDKAPVVVLIHGIYGLSDWVRAAADQVAAAGFIALAPDLLSGKGPGGGGADSVDSRDDVVRLMRELEPPEVNQILGAVRGRGIELPAADGKSATVGFCWGGGASFAYATVQPNLEAAVVFYGTSPDTDRLASIEAPVLGLYGGDDARVNMTIDAAAAEMKRLDKIFEFEIYDGAGHAFLQRQKERDGANRRATERSWPRAMAFLKQHTGE